MKARKKARVITEIVQIRQEKEISPNVSAENG